MEKLLADRIETDTDAEKINSNIKTTKKKPVQNQKKNPFKQNEVT